MLYCLKIVACDLKIVVCDLKIVIYDLYLFSWNANNEEWTLTELSNFNV